MKFTPRSHARPPVRLRAVMVLCLTLASVSAAFTQSFTLEVVDQSGLPVGEYRWLLQEDTTVRFTEETPAALSTGFHTSYAPVVSKGDETSGSIPLPDPGKRYFVSVLPDSGYTMSGMPVPEGGGTVRVTVHRHPIPTAQISVFVFEDTNPINNAPDEPEERGLAGFKVTVEDGGGRYGVSAGAQMMDAFGNPIGTIYGTDGSVVRMGAGVVATDENGYALIENLAPGKYGIVVIPPDGQEWVQTATIEGTKVIDAWVKANEPPFFVEFGPPGPHVFVGFVRPMKDPEFFTGSNTLSGRVVNLHTGRPPNFSFNPGNPFPAAYVGLNDAPGGTGRGVYVAKTDDESRFSITGVPDGTYQLVIWDENLDIIFAMKDVTLDGGDLDLGDVPVFAWFGRLETMVFEDRDKDGFRDEGEIGIGEQVVNIRFRDGTVYQTMPTDTEGYSPFDEVFPFFNWLVAEVDFTRLKATGATVVVDAGGPVPPDNGWDMPSHDVLNPQEQDEVNPHTGNNLSRTQTGEVLTQAFQVFLGQTNVIEFGKAPYDPTENGGISGIVHYAATRAEDDPRLAAAEPWEPGIPRVQVNLYRDDDDDLEIDDVNGVPGIQLADVDNFPFGWADGGVRGDEDIDRDDPMQVLVSDAAAVFDPGDAVDITWTDSWDDNRPSGAQGSNGPGFEHLDAFDGLRNFNQVRPGVFDGGYAFTGLEPGIYIVEAVTPPGYEHAKEEDKNVDFGDEYVGPSLPVGGGVVLPGDPPDNQAVEDPALDNQPLLAGDLRVVPDELTLFPGVPAPFAGETRRLPDRKQVKLAAGLNSAANFFMFTEVPVAGQIVGFILDDLSNEFDLNAPTFGEKHAPPFLPVTVRDWTGRLVNWTVSDQYGTYNVLVPSTYTANLPQPSGMSPNMLTVVINDPGHPDGVPHNPQYSQFSYTFQYMPGATTYLDTPVVPIAAFAGPGQYPVDLEFEDGTPVISHIDGGPYVESVGDAIEIVSMGTVTVANPEYDGSNARWIERDFGFGDDEGTVTIGGRSLAITDWQPGRIVAAIPAGTSTGQLVVTRGDTGRSSLLGITVTIGPLGNGPTGQPRNILHVNDGESIQAALDAANPGDLILVGPGYYEETLFMYEPVQLQGWGPGVTTINAVQVPHDKILDWRLRAKDLWTAGAFDLLPSQGLTFLDLEPALAAIEGAGITVFARNVTPALGGFGPAVRARIDGFTIEGSSTGGGVVVNGYAHYLEISNNRIRQNAGFQGGGVTVGHPLLTIVTDEGEFYQHAQNDHVRIHNNQIIGNGGLNGTGGGVALYTGSDYYEVTDNLIAGNFMSDNGGGVGHLGRSVGGTIARNRILFNQSFNQGLQVSGGGVFVGGGAALGPGAITEGAGSVTIEANLIQGNLAGSGDGGGIRVQSTLPGDLITIRNNMIVNNIAGLAGGGISLQDAADVTIAHNTIAHNDSTATAGEAFFSAMESAPQIAGLVSRAHSPGFRSLTGNDYSMPVLDSNIIWRNRAFFFRIDPVDPRQFGLLPAFDPDHPEDFTSYADIGVTFPGGSLVQTNSVLTGGPREPALVAAYFNRPRDPTILQLEGIVLEVMPAFDEGGNFIDVRFGPLSAGGTDYHLAAPLTGGSPGLADYDGDPNADDPDIGADQYTGPLAGRAPSAVNDGFLFPLPLGNRAVTLTIAAPGVLANDWDPDGDSLAVSITPVVSPANGTLVLNANGSFSYTIPERSVFTGIDSFTYRVSDGSRSSTAVVTIDVTRVLGNEAPNPTALPLITLINTVGSTRILPNDPDLGDTHTYQITQQPIHGTAAVSSSGTVTYTPDTNFLGSETITVRVTDQFGAFGTVTFEADVGLNLPPTFDLIVQMPQDTDGEDTDGDGDPDNDNVYLLLGAGDGFSTMADGYEQYMFGFSDLSHMLQMVMPYDPANPALKSLPLEHVMHHGMLGAEWPAPTIKVREGQKLYLNLVNTGMHMRPDLFDPHSVHWHGFPQAAPVFDGVPDASISINMSAALTYFYRVVQPGTYMYHCHVEATEHMQMGMLGNLYVLPMQDNFRELYPKNAQGDLYTGFAYNDGDGSTGYDKDFPIQIGGFDPAFHDASLKTQPLPFATMKDRYPMLNGRGYPDTTVAGSLAPNSVNTFVENGTVSLGVNQLQFDASGSELSLVSGAYDGFTLMFTSGALEGVTRRIADYDVTVSPRRTQTRITLDEPLPMIPPRFSTFLIGKPTQNVSSRIEAVQGDRILLRISSLDVTRFYTLASTIPMRVVGLNARLLRGPDPDGDGPETGENLYYTTNSVTLGGGEALDAILDTADVAPGTYLLYTTNLNYLSNNTEDFGGMMTEIVITPRD